MLPALNMWTIHFPDGTTNLYAYAGPAREEFRAADAVRFLAERYWSRTVFSVSPAGCSGLAPTLHFGRPCPVHKEV